ncbi:hypothetical protein SNE40_020743 [Patella caerulea]|uniref:Uncharacterized protein n=1 Tax=Patella caerulea TaxID=87958 RepID=A0AAN8P7R3_PATCE
MRNRLNSDVVWKLLVMDNSTIFSELLNEPLNELLYEKQKPNDNSPTAALGVEAMDIGTETIHNEPFNEPLNDPLNELLNELLYEKRKPNNNSPTVALGVEAMNIDTETVHNEPLYEQQKPNNSPTAVLGVEAMAMYIDCPQRTASTSQTEAQQETVCL